MVLVRIPSRRRLERRWRWLRRQLWRSLRRQLYAFRSARPSRQSGRNLEEGRGIGCGAGTTLTQDVRPLGRRSVNRMGGGVLGSYGGLGHRDRTRAFYRHGVRSCRLRISSGTVLQPLGRWGCGLGGRVWRVYRKSCSFVNCMFYLCVFT